MKELRFEWDKKKSTSNEKKHGVSFEEVLSIFLCTFFIGAVPGIGQAIE